MKNSTFVFIFGLAVFALILAGCPQEAQQQAPQDNATLVGGDRDEHGCIGSAGYTWCEAKQKCLRAWEEECETAAFSPEIERRMDEAVQNRIETLQPGTELPSIIVGVWVPGEGSWTKAYGYSDLYAGKELELDDKVRIGSNTKTFVATVILQLQDEGKLSLDDRLGKYDLGVEVPNADNITLRELGSMTSGLFGYLKDEEVVEEFLANPMINYTPKELIEIGISHPPDFAPGTNYTYSNTGYVLLGMIIEKVTGNPLDEEIRTRILEPYGLDETSFPITYAGMPCPYAHGYTWTDNSTWEDMTITKPTWAWAAGAMVSDMEDMKVWVKAYTTGTTNSEGAQRDRLTFVDTGSAVYTFGFGIVNMSGWLGYTGGLPGYNTAAYYLPEKDATIIVFAMGGKEDNVANIMLIDLMNITTPEKLEGVQLKW